MESSLRKDFRTGEDFCSTLGKGSEPEACSVSPCSLLPRLWQGSEKGRLSKVAQQVGGNAGPELRAPELDYLGSSPGSDINCRVALSE